MIRILFILLFFSVGARLFAQNAVTENNSFAKVSIKYSSDYVFMGRTDSLAAPYLTPSFIYFHKSGFFATGAFSYLTSANQNRIDLSIFSIGYDAIGKSLYGGGAINAYFFNTESYSVASAMVGFLDGYIGYDFDILDVSADASLGLSDKLDVFTGIEVSRIFYLLDYRLLITPSVYTNAGSQNYYNEYYNTRNSQITLGGGYGKGKGKGTNGSVPTATNMNTEVMVEEASKFQFLDYEFSGSTTYKIKNWRLNFTAKYIIPVNPSTITVDNDIVFEESLNNVFFWSASLGYSFK